jgi:hypothetical protein
MQFGNEAFKHGKTQEDIEFLYASYLTEWFPNGVSERGNERAMLVGFDQVGNLMEAALELVTTGDGTDEEYFYHAMEATPEWQKQYQKMRRQHE